MGFQSIPIQLRSVQKIYSALLFIGYNGVKCYTIAHVCWKSRTEANKTALHLHNLAHNVNELYFYNISNHLSLKLSNNRLRFNVCGFFDLDMTTIFGMTGAITSYLIILIQFNSATMRNTKEV